VSDDESSRLGHLCGTSYALAAVLMTLYGIVIWLDSSSLTAEPSQRGATHEINWPSTALQLVDYTPDRQTGPV
jgi:hypothetical protein